MCDCNNFWGEKLLIVIDFDEILIRKEIIIRREK